MQPSEMTNDELASYIVNTIGGGIFREYYAEVAERLRRLKVAEDALEKCVNYNNSWELEAAKENAKNALAVIRGKGANDETK